MTIAFDSSALMAFVLEEPGADVAEGYLSQGVVSAVIFAETLSKLGLKGHDLNEVRARFEDYGLVVDPVDEKEAFLVAELHDMAKSGISLADRFCLSHALVRGLPVITADRPWRELSIPVELRFIR